MHRHRHSRHGHRFHPFGGFFWLFLLAFFFLGGRWWPGILILIGVSILFGSLFREEDHQPPADLPRVNAPVPPSAPITVSPAVVSRPVEPIHRADRLPADCPQCGGPVRAQEVRWTGKQSAACAYCGSSLPMKKG
ncbi:MAG: hypothetical protein QM730_11030 [Anaerolineales bacterium]